MYHRHYDKTVEFLQKVKPDYLQEQQDEDTTGETTTGATISKKNGVRTTTISVRLRHGDCGQARERGRDYDALQQGEHYRGE